MRGYANQGERFEKQRRRQVLAARLKEVEARIAGERVSIVRGGRRLLNTRHHLDQAELTEQRWRDRWRSERLFICADGERDKRWGNETIRVDPNTGVVEVKLPGQLAQYTNAPHNRLRLADPVRFKHRGGEWAAQATTGAVRYDIAYDPARGRWYLDASWKIDPGTPLTVEQATAGGLIAVDLNDGHLAITRLDSTGNPVGRPETIPVANQGPQSLRDASVRDAISTLIGQAKAAGVGAIAVENLNFADARQTGRETIGRGQKGKRFRKTVSGLPTGRFRDRLAHMAANAGLAVVAVEPAYTSKWGARYWQAALTTKTFKASRHHAASVVIGRRAQQHRARRRRRRCDTTRPEDRSARANADGRESYQSAGMAAVCAPANGSGGKAAAQHHPVRKTRTGKPTTTRGSPPNTVRGRR